MSKPQASKRARNIKRIERTDRPPKPQPEEEGRYMGPEKNQVEYEPHEEGVFPRIKGESDASYEQRYEEYIQSYLEFMRGAGC